VANFPWKVAVAGGVAFGASTVALIALQKGEARAPERVALIGDSYAVGLGPELPGVWYEGHVGLSTFGWLSCGACWGRLAAFRPELVLVSLGVNDGSTPNLANYQAIVKDIHGMGARVVWIEPPAAVRTAARAVIASLGVPTVPATRTPLSTDGLHPVDYGPWAQEIAEVIRVS
jgi:hypothetical protein